MARGNPLINEEDLEKGKKRFDPNLRDEGAGFFKTLFTAGSNLGSDAVTELGYIAQAVARPVDTGEAVLRVLAGYAQKALPNDWEAYLPEDWATNKMYANAINDYYAEKYGSLEQAADSFAEQPVSVALDAFAVKALLTTISKQAAKKATATNKLAKTAEGTILEGELAARAAAELKVAEELNRTVKYEGKLVWDDALGAYVPESSVPKPPKINSAEVAPLIDDIENATPNNNPAVANVVDDSVSIEALDAREKARRAQLSPELRAMEDAILVERMNAFSDPNFTLVGSTTVAEEAAKRMASGKEGMITATRNQEASPALMDAAKIASETGTPIRVTSDDIAYYQMLKEAEARGGDFEGMAGYLSPEQLRALEAATGDSVLDKGVPRFSDPDLPFNTTDKNKQRMADDAAMAAATQGDLFSNANAAAYEAYQASRLANEARAASESAKAAPTGMITSRATGPISRTENIDIPSVPPRTLTDKPTGPVSRTKDIDIPPPPRLTAKPESASRGFKDLEINPSRVLPAAQRVAAAASQTGLQGNRDIDGSLIPIAPDKGIDLIPEKPESGLLEDMPPYEKSIDNRDIGTKSSEKPGWYQGVSPDEGDDGNYWSADFEDEYWNTPAGVQEAIGIWGRPIGNRIGQRFN